jgi:hypothetical protein
MSRSRITTALAAAIVATLVVAAPAVANHVFSDVPDDHTHAEGIHWASEQGLVEGFPDGTFRPVQPVSRGQLSTILERQHAYRGPVYSLTPSCGSLDMMMVEHNGLGSGEANVEYSVDGGDRIVLDGGIPADEPEFFTAAEAGIVSLFVDGIAWAHAPTAQDCAPPAP